MRRKIALALMLAICAMVGACNTVQGIGRDLERGGEKVQETAKDVQRKL